MRRWLVLGAVLTGLIGWLAWRYDDVPPPMPNPEDGAVSGGVFKSAYFALAYPLPSDWIEGLAGPPPSESGYYVLKSIVPNDGPAGNILIAAQDMFFAATAISGTAELAAEFRRAMGAVEGMTIDREPSEVRVPAGPLWRVDFSGVGLYRAVFATQIRCHFVTFHLTARDPAALAELALSLDGLVIAPGGETAPICLKDYAAGDNLLRRVEPAAAAGPAFGSVPVRIVIGADGRVRHVHVLRASTTQRSSIESALAQWQFKPYRAQDRLREVETGLVFRFASALH